METHGGERNPDENRYHLSKSDDIGPELNNGWALNDTHTNKPSDFTLSAGNWRIIGIGAVVILGGIAAILIVNRKKKKSFK